MDVPEFEALVTELEQRVDRLRSLYEQYFMGIEKTIPSVPLKDVERRIQALRRDQPRNTGLRFRFQMIIQRYNTYQSYWQRICREIEEGTYKRHIIRAKKKFAATEPQADAARPVLEPGRTASGAYELSLDDAIEDESDVDGLLKDYVSEPPPPVVPAAGPVGKWRKVEPKPKAEPVARKVPSPSIVMKAEPPIKLVPAVEVDGTSAPEARRGQHQKAEPAPKPKPAALEKRPLPPPKPGDLSDDRVRQIYAQYVQAKRAHNESTAQVTYENLAKTIRDSTAKLREKHAGKSIDFEVGVKDGKTVLKPVVK